MNATHPFDTQNRRNAATTTVLFIVAETRQRRWFLLAAVKSTTAADDDAAPSVDNGYSLRGAGKLPDFVARLFSFFFFSGSSSRANRTSALTSRARHYTARRPTCIAANCAVFLYYNYALQPVRR